MSKTKIDRKVNKIVKAMNENLKADVFKDRFWFKQIQKAKNSCGMEYYLYELCDRLEPNRNSVISRGWIWGETPFFESHLWEEMNDFIVKSSFCSIYYNDSSRYDYDLDNYAHPFYPYHLLKKKNK